MDKRLQGLLSLIPPGRGLIDVGTDHGYLPSALAKAAYPGALYASDLRPGPLSTAKATAAREGLGERIHFLLCDGLELCPPEEVDCIVIAGMGGDTICGILDRAEWCMSRDYLLVLQPMTKAEVLRYWLSNNGFQIERELLIEERRSLYQCLSARYTGQNEMMTDAELFLGKAERAENNELRERLRQSCLKQLSSSIRGLSSAKNAVKDPSLSFYLGLSAQMEA